MNSPFAVRVITLSALITSLCACGGGGGGGGEERAPAASFSVSPASLTFNAVSANAGPPPAQTLTGSVSGTINGTLFINVTLGGAVVTVSDVVINGPNSGQAQVIPMLPATLGPGSHTDTLTVRACTTNINCTSGQLAGSPQTIAVTYTINGIRTPASGLTYTVNDATTPADLIRQVQIAGFPLNATWTATSSVSWLITPSSGALANGGGQLTASLDQAHIDGLPNGTYTTAIVLTPQAGNPITVPVTVNVERTEVSFVSPYVAEMGSSREVVIRGEKLPVAPTVSFGGTPATSVNRVSETEIRATYPSSLPEGTHMVQVGGVSRSRARLVVVSVPVYAAERLDYSAGFSPKRITYDAERKTILVARYDNLTSASNEFVRFVHDAGGWSEPQRHTTHNLTDMVLTADGSEWLVTRYSPISVQHFGANDLTLRTTSLDEQSAHSAFLSRIAVANDGFAIMGGRFGSACGVLSSYRVRAPRFVWFNPAANACSTFIAASADGSVVIAGTNSQGNIDRYIASTGLLETVSPNPILELTSLPVIDRHGNRIVLNATQVYGSNFALLGELPSTTRAVALSADSSVAWTFDNSGQLRKFDLLAATVGGLFPEITPSTSLPSSPGSGEVVMTTTPESKVLFVAGSEGVVVVPAP